MTPDVAILGAGRFALTVAALLRGQGLNVHLWARADAGRTTAAKAVEGVQVFERLSEAATGAPVVIFGVPASAVRSVASELGEIARPDQIVLHAVRGLCPGDGFVLPHRVIRSETCLRKIGVLGGPLYAADAANHHAMATVVASRFDEVPAAVRQLTEGTPVHVDASRDIVGVEICGAVSAVSALAVGMADSLGLGDTARGILLAHGLSEAARFGVAMGADPTTTWGLAGVGDLVPRKVSSTEAAHAVGAKLANGTPLKDAVREQSTEVEGVHSARAFAEEAARRNIEVPLLRAVHGICTGAIEAAVGLEGVLRCNLELGNALRPH